MEKVGIKASIFKLFSYFNKGMSKNTSFKAFHAHITRIEISINLVTEKYIDTISIL